jgi:hypothetical protein
LHNNLDPRPPPRNMDPARRRQRPMPEVVYASSSRSRVLYLAATALANAMQAHHETFTVQPLICNNPATSPQPAHIQNSLAPTNQLCSNHSVSPTNQLNNDYSTIFRGLQSPTEFQDAFASHAAVLSGQGRLIASRIAPASHRYPRGHAVVPGIHGQRKR